IKRPSSSSNSRSVIVPENSFNAISDASLVSINAFLSLLFWFDFLFDSFPSFLSCFSCFLFCFVSSFFFLTFLFSFSFSFFFFSFFFVLFLLFLILLCIVFFLFNRKILIFIFF